MLRSCAAAIRGDHQQGFSLLELAIVTVIVSVIAASGLVVGEATIESTRVVATNNRMDVIETALLAYRRANDRLPCPANLSLPNNNANYGVEAANPGTCTGGTPSASDSYSAGGDTVVEGAVPVRVLNLPDEFMYDGWGRRIVYAVWSPITGSKGFINYGVESNCGSMTIRNSVGAARSNRGLYTLLSHGANGHAGYNISGQRVSTTIVNVDEQINCHCNAAAAETGYLGTYVQRDYAEDPANPFNSFDDIVRFKERWQMQNYFDEYNPGGYLTCPSVGIGNRTYGTAANDNVGSAIALGDINADGFDDIAIGVPRTTAVGSAGSVAVVFGTADGIPNPLMLSALNGENGFWVNSSSIGDRAGSALVIGDLNEDGIKDLVIGAPGAFSGNGGVYTVYGHVNPWATTTSIASLGADGFILENDVISGSNEAFGSAVAVGDISYDGRNDLVVGAPAASSNAGAVYTFLGRSTPWSNSEVISTRYANVSSGRANERAGTSVIVADMDADYVPDIIVGMPGDGVTMRGRVGVFTGRRWGWQKFRFFRVYGKRSYYINGESAGSEFGRSLASVDVNGDRIFDLVVGAPGHNADAGAVYIVFGSTRRRRLHWWPGSYLNGKIGARITGIAANDRAGSAVSGTDVNGDGIGDIVIGAPGASPGGLNDAGTSYVMFGKLNWTADISVSTLNGTTGFLLNGSTAGDNIGTVLAVGDINRDFIGDILLGAPLADYSATNAGVVYMFYGQRQDPPWTLAVDLNSL